MGVGFGGNPVFNRASPSSHAMCVARIVADYVVTAQSRPVRILDIGGTRTGFRQHAALPPDVQVVVANPERGADADFAYVSDIPANAPGFDLAMLFGVMMYLGKDDLLSLMRDVRQRLRGHGTLLIAEPDPEGVVGRVEVAAKRLYAAIKSAWDPTRFTFYTKAETQALLRTAGFATIRERPDLTPNAMGVFPPPMPPYYVIAASI
jgi:SAM-dependent methyltransferase